MKKEELDILLERYYEGLSTDEDEKALKVFFSGNDMPEGYETEKAYIQVLFRFFQYTAPSEGFRGPGLCHLLTRLSHHGCKRSFNKIVLAVSGIAAGLLYPDWLMVLIFRE